MRKLVMLYFRLALICSLTLVFTNCSRFEKDGRANSADASESRLSKSPQTALDKYVAAPDTNFNFHLIKSVPCKDQTTFILEMTSQSWLTTNEVDRPLWKHWVIIVKPDTVSSSKGFLFITGGNNC